MKIPPLPDTDLARIAPLPVDQKRRALEAFRLSHPPYRYVPFRKALPDILNIQTGFLRVTERVPFASIEQTIRAESRSAEELAANLLVAQSLYDHAAAGPIEGRSLELFPLSVGSGTKLVFWHSFLLIRDGQPIIPFFDPRRSTTRLTALARQFVFSTMHERIRAADPDFAEVKFAIWQFTSPSKGQPRVAFAHEENAIPLLSFEQIETMVQETYEMWADIYSRRAKTEPRRRASGAGFL
ncbi:hypothetical protein CWO91_40060 [Bradyrhizobium genosp. SA-3]|uniref:type VI toxin-antitoxin system SocB family DNA replication inhibitor toxin n=1 Tax=Bradyrhizobium genosp. SA-3 TaxID=508868 RepID=UPI001029A7FD|nr:hypothetical protein [Bradyrhizobium genosp. SA-3]RZM93216.1 hypothetical protein CWO91_40060 [Bradyrhizobium genosp. SA-3]